MFAMNVRIRPCTRTPARAAARQVCCAPPGLLSHTLCKARRRRSLACSCCTGLPTRRPPCARCGWPWPRRCACRPPGRRGQCPLAARGISSCHPGPSWAAPRSAVARAPGRPAPGCPVLRQRCSRLPLRPVPAPLEAWPPAARPAPGRFLILAAVPAARKRPVLSGWWSAAPGASQHGRAGSAGAAAAACTQLAVLSSAGAAGCQKAGAQGARPAGDLRGRRSACRRPGPTSRLPGGWLHKASPWRRPQPGP